MANVHGLVVMLVGVTDLIDTRQSKIDDAEARYRVVVLTLPRPPQDR